MISYSFTGIYDYFLAGCSDFLEQRNCNVLKVQYFTLFWCFILFIFNICKKIYLWFEVANTISV